MLDNLLTVVGDLAYAREPIQGDRDGNTVTTWPGGDDDFAGDVLGGSRSEDGLVDGTGRVVHDLWGNGRGCRGDGGDASEDKTARQHGWICKYGREAMKLE